MLEDDRIGQFVKTGAVCRHHGAAIVGRGGRDFERLLARFDPAAEAGERRERLKAGGEFREGVGRVVGDECGNFDGGGFFAREIERHAVEELLAVGAGFWHRRDDLDSLGDAVFPRERLFVVAFIPGRDHRDPLEFHGRIRRRNHRDAVRVGRVAVASGGDGESCPLDGNPVTRLQPHRVFWFPRTVFHLAVVPVWKRPYRDEFAPLLVLRLGHIHRAKSDRKHERRSARVVEVNGDGNLRALRVARGGGVERECRTQPGCFGRGVNSIVRFAPRQRGEFGRERRTVLPDVVVFQLQKPTVIADPISRRSDGIEKLRRLLRSPVACRVEPLCERIELRVLVRQRPIEQRDEPAGDVAVLACVFLQVRKMCAGVLILRQHRLWRIQIDYLNINAPRRQLARPLARSGSELLAAFARGGEARQLQLAVELVCARLDGEIVIPDARYIINWTEKRNGEFLHLERVARRQKAVLAKQGPVVRHNRCHFLLTFCVL